jgi:hypothetical protein
MRASRTLADGACYAGWSVVAYFMFAAQVHENHAYLAVLCLAIAAGLNPSVSARS